MGTLSVKYVELEHAAGFVFPQKGCIEEHLVDFERHRGEGKSGPLGLS